VGESNQQKIRAEEILVELAKSYPELVMQKVGEVILSEEYRWQFLRGRYRFLIQNLPLDAVKKWLSSYHFTKSLIHATSLRPPL
jgi:hypothetical protein